MVREDWPKFGEAIGERNPFDNFATSLELNEVNRQTRLTREREREVWRQIEVNVDEGVSENNGNTFYSSQQIFTN